MMMVGRTSGGVRGHGQRCATVPRGPGLHRRTLQVPTVQRAQHLRAQADSGPSTSQTTSDVRTLTELISLESAKSLGAEQAYSLEQIAKALDVPVATVRNMAFKRKGLISLTAEDVQAKIAKVAQIVDVPLEKARQMCIIQPGLLTDTEKNADVLSNGLKLICYDLKAPREEIIDLIINNPSILHGRELRLSVADMANLAMMREPKGRIVD